MGKMEKVFNELKEKHSKIYWLDIPESDENGEKTIFLRKIDRVTYSASQKLLEKDTLQATEMILRSLFVGGDSVEGVINDFDQLRAASELLVDVITVKKGNVRTS